MAKSLQEQLMGKGLIDKKQAKAIQKEKREKRKQAPKGQQEINEEKLLIEKLKQEKIEKDKALNKKRLDELEKKAIKAQVKQLLESNQIKREQGDVPFQFTHDKKIKKIYVSDFQFKHLSRGILAIGSINDDYIIVPAGVARKIMERDTTAIHYYFDARQNEQSTQEEEDPYKGFEIPDDLMW
jgi:uncharacterized protein YaiL (DUF2058 family)